MKLDLRIANPAGNITIFVMTPVSPEDYTQIASGLLSLPEYKAEQVAFLTLPQKGGMGRIQMMGGEFCGNATRSFGFLLSQMKPDHPSRVTVEISGAPEPLEVEIDYENNCCKTQMPPLKEQVSISYEGESFDAMIFEGIVHLIVPGCARTEAFIHRLIKAAQQVVTCDAYGVMFLDGLALTPAVYVVDTDSLIWEGSCGSGSMACACYYSLEEPDGFYSYQLTQPGGLIEAQVTKKDQRFAACSMGGPIVLSDLIQIEI